MTITEILDKTLERLRSELPENCHIFIAVTDEEAMQISFVGNRASASVVALLGAISAEVTGEALSEAYKAGVAAGKAEVAPLLVTPEGKALVH